MRRRFYLADNPGAGYGSRRLLDRVIVCLRARDAQIERVAHVSAEAAEAAMREVALSGRVDALIAAGGDGTVRLAAKAALGTDIPVGIVSLGTGNVLAHEVGLPRQPDAIARLLMEGTARTVNSGRANGELFLLMAGAGFDGRVIATLDQRLKRTVGKLAYAGPTLKALAHGPDALEVILDGTVHKACWAVIANASRYGGRFLMAPGTKVDRPGLQAILFHGPWRRQRMAQLMALATGRLEGRTGPLTSDVSMIACRRAEIRSRVPVPVQIDGDPFATTPLVVEDAGRDCRLILPSA